MRATRNYIRKVFWPNLVVTFGFHTLNMPAYACFRSDSYAVGLKPESAGISGQNPSSMKASAIPDVGMPTMRYRRLGWNERGSVTIVVLLLMIAVTIIGVMSINTSVVEMKIASNEKGVRQSFYLSEGTALEGVQRLSDAKKMDLDEKITFWHHSRRQVRDRNIDFRYIDDWEVDGQEEENALRSPMGQNLYMTAVEWRLATGSSAIVTGSRLYLNRVYGLCQTDQSQHIVEIGYYMRY